MNSKKLHLPLTICLFWHKNAYSAGPGLSLEQLTALPSPPDGHAGAASRQNMGMKSEGKEQTNGK